jgi:hypothetical protein
LQAFPWPVVVRGVTKQCMQQLAHRLELQAGLAPQPRTVPRCHLAPEAAELREILFLLADVGETAACLPEAGGDGAGPGGGRPGEVMGSPPDAAPILAVSTALL